ncbi:hypothetical protein SPONN_1063 [uncultured Candidatus Thioglobus sp.]|nr:hypothetical protein SPONN_1063 [uncultured Candidatus Thioglobus sp.]
MILSAIVMISAVYRFRLARECAGELLNKISRNEEAALHFIVALERKLTMIAEQSFVKTTGKHSTKREKLWTAFYTLRANDLFGMWNKMISRLKMQDKFTDMWLPQTVARVALESIVKAKYPVEMSASNPQITVDSDEQNALRYAAGFVFMSLKKKYSSMGVTAITDWINKQADTDSVDSADSFQEFTKSWIRKVNRGGLFCVSDSAYDLFLAMEKLLRQYLEDLSVHQGIDKDRVMSSIEEDDEIQSMWSLLAIDLTEETEKALLKQTIQLWLTIRGFSYASAIVEEYKRSCGALKRKKALRKELKEKSKTKKAAEASEN